jgi:hypothetical protein
VIAAGLAVSVPAKAKAADQYTDVFRPVFTTQTVAEARGYLASLDAMDRRLTTNALPDLAQPLRVSPGQLDATLEQSAPAVTSELQQHNIKNFLQADAIPTKGSHMFLTARRLGFAVPAPRAATARPRFLVARLAGGRCKNHNRCGPDETILEPRPAMANVATDLIRALR